MPDYQKPLRIGHLTTAYHTNFILMADPKIPKSFKRPLEWHYFSTGPEMMWALYRGELDAGYLGLTPAMIGIEKGVPIKCIAGGHIEGTILCAKPGLKAYQNFDNNLELTFQQLSGKIIGVPKEGSIHDVILRYYLSRFKLLDRITIRNYDEAEFIALDLQKGEIQAGMGTPSLAAFSEYLGSSQIIIPPEALWPYNPSYGVFFTRNCIETDPESITLFLKFHKAAEDILTNNPLKASNCIASVFNIVEPAYFLKVLRISPHYCIALDDRYIDSAMKLMEEMIKLGYLKKRKSIDEIFDPALVKEIHPEPAHYYKGSNRKR